MTDKFPGDLFPFLSGGGEMGHLVRNYDWAQSPIGTPDQWPQSLRTTVTIILHSHFPMLIFWGPAMISIYNDAFRPSLGSDGKHPSMLGQTAEKAWPELPERMAFLRRDILGKAQSVYKEDEPVSILRNGYLEEAYWIYSYSPVIAEDGKPGGILVTCFETTPRIKDRQQLIEKAEQLAFVITAAELGTWDMDLFTERMDTNARLRQLFGFDENAVITMKDCLQCILPADRQRVVDGIEKAKVSSDGAFDVEYIIVNCHTGMHLVIRSKGKVWFDEQGKPYRFIGTMQDITEKASTLTSLIKSEKQFRSLIEQAPIATCLFVGPELRIEVANDIMIQFWGQGAGVLGKPLREAVPELEGQPFLAILDNVYRTGIPYEAVDTPAVLSVNGIPGTYYFDFIYKPLLDENGEVYAIMEVATEVTERVQARLKINEVQTNLLALFEQTPFAIATIAGDDHLTFQTANAAYAELTGRPANELIGKPLLEALPELQGQGFDQLLKEVLATGKTFSASEIPVTLLREGVLQVRYVNFSYIARTGTGGQITGILVTAIDITDQVLARQAVEQSETLFKTLVDSAPFPIGVYTGRDMRILHANPAIVEVYGKGPDVVGKSYIEMLPELEGQGIFEQLQEVYHTGQPFHSGVRRVDIAIHGDLTPFYFSYNFFPLFDAKQQVYGVLNTAVNVTELELSRQRAQRAETDLRMAIELAALASWTYDMANHTFHLSGRLQDWLGIDGPVIAEQTFFEMLPPDSHQAFQQALNKAIVATDSASFDIEYAVVNAATGHRRFIHSRAQRLTSEGYGKTTLSGTARDITHERELQWNLERQVAERTAELAQINQQLTTLNTALETNNAQLQQSNDELAQYAYVTSHDLQEPLRKIRVFISILVDKRQLTQDVADILRKIDTSASRMTQLINDLLSMSRLLQYDHQVFQPVDLSAIMELVKDDFEIVIAEKAASVTCSSLPVIEGIGLQLNQLFNNLLGNALKFSAPGKPPIIDITARLLSAEEVTALTGQHTRFDFYHDVIVSDNGIGFDPAYTDYIFEIFKRLHTKDNYPGSGIGLALCQRIMVNHRGFLFASSVPGEGSRFHAIFPVINHSEK